MLNQPTGYPSIDKPWLKYYTEEAINAQPYTGSVYSHIYDNNKDYLSDTALQYFGKKICYKELFDMVDCVAAVLISKGINEGDNVILLMRSGMEVAIVRRIGDSQYEMISGHRRLFAEKLIGFETVPTIVKEMSDDQATLPRFALIAWICVCEAMKKELKAS